MTNKQQAQELVDALRLNRRIHTLDACSITEAALDDAEARGRQQALEDAAVEMDANELLEPDMYLGDRHVVARWLRARKAAGDTLEPHR